MLRENNINYNDNKQRRNKIHEKYAKILSNYLKLFKIPGTTQVTDISVYQKK